ncbi:hypothetical protein [Streptomyces tailanensis]|uniref:hypothetical protein n=1 Tax=Streptomyces tailanensis TaxID=2569858 RepID=UPI00122DC892|nr:hypothetical protein [Streptomyces tailanensis]
MSAGTTVSVCEVNPVLIRDTCETVMGTVGLTDTERVRLGCLLVEQVRVLVPKVAMGKQVLSGEWLRTAQHVLDGTGPILMRSKTGSVSAVHDLAVQCRALLTLYEHCESVTEPTAGDDTEGARS